jgi:hypothetical protein
MIKSSDHSNFAGRRRVCCRRRGVIENLDLQVLTLATALARLKGDKVVIVEKGVDRTTRRRA